MYDDDNREELQITSGYVYSPQQHLAYRLAKLHSMRESGMPQFIVSEQYRMVRVSLARVLAEARRANA